MNERKFEVCPEYKGPAVCADVTPMKRYETPYGPKDKFKLVFEIGLERGDGARYAVWSKPFTPSSHERSGFAAFMKDWFGHALTKEEWEKLDTEDLVGRPAEIVVVHEHVNGETYANIKLIMPDRSGNPLKLSGKFVRAKDRASDEGRVTGDGGQDGGAEGDEAGGARGGGTYRRMEPVRGGGETTGTGDEGDQAAVKIHVGRCKGLELRDLAPEQVQALLDNWLPTAKANPKPLADDRRLMAALEWWQATREKEADNVPY